MKPGISTVICGVVAFLIAGASAYAEDTAPSPNGIELPRGYRDWAVIAPSHRGDNGTLRVILGNSVAVAAARAGDTHPWPDGAILGKLVWKDRTHPKWQGATVPGEFVHAEFMLKDSASYQSTGGWGFARWIGTEQKPYGESADFARECFGCHLPVAESDYVFTIPAELPPGR